jgi:hypothetical protein
MNLNELKKLLDIKDAIKVLGPDWVIAAKDLHQLLPKLSHDAFNILAHSLDNKYELRVHSYNYQEDDEQFRLSLSLSDDTYRVYWFRVEDSLLEVIRSFLIEFETLKALFQYLEKNSFIRTKYDFIKSVGGYTATIIIKIDQSSSNRDDSRGVVITHTPPKNATDPLQILETQIDDLPKIHRFLSEFTTLIAP